MTASSLYAGSVVHDRVRPVRHRLCYRLFMGLFDLDELPALSRQVWAFGYNRQALISFHDGDHCDGSGRPLRCQLEAKLRAAGIAFDGGPIRVLCMPRVLSYVFNPLSVFFCFGRGGRLAAIVHEVNNTFGERHFYVLPAQGSSSGRIEQTCDKAFRVSPFLGADLRYRFTIDPPADRVSVAITVSDASEPVLVTWFTGNHRPFTSASILLRWLLHPALTVKIILAIHWEAIWIWLKLRRAARGVPGGSARHEQT